MDLLAFGRDAVEVNNESGPEIHSRIDAATKSKYKFNFVDPRKGAHTSAAAQHVD